ncbi:MAG: TAXI family TRAP transporter solute-binding subunit [Deltaproteobacteria bacterium]|nr:TAXI family TRAP transporter solute-binding subunit [Deltaproteobacteria bacterium]
MKRKPTVIWIICLVASLVLSAAPNDLRAREIFITIGSGDFTGVYYPTGLILARMINAKRDVYGIRAAVEATNGATFNLNGIMAGYLEFGLAQSDTQYQAINGRGAWEQKGPQKDLRAVFSLHHEAVTLVAAVDAGIKTLSDLKGKRVSLGNPGISRHRIVMDILEAAGLDPKRDLTQFDVMASDAPALMQDNRIDAYFFTVGHPNETVQKALSGDRQARIVPISGPAIDRLVADKSYYIHGSIPVKRLYPGGADQPDVPTMGVLAALCTSSRVSEDVVYALTREVFDNFEMFRRQHPAYYNLSKEGMLKGLSAPLHPGALRYYRETGLIH